MTNVAVAALDPPEDPQLYFMGRTPTAPDLTLKLSEVDHLLAQHTVPVQGTV